MAFKALSRCGGRPRRALVEQRGTGGGLHAHAIAFGVAALAGFVSSWQIARAPELRMPDAGPDAGLRARLRAPFHDRNFRRLLVFMGAWIVASNPAAPFLTVYLIQQRGFPVTTVTALWVVSQMANATTLYLWGRLSDRLSNKAVLAVALPVTSACMPALVFADAAGDETTQLVLLAVVHVVLGVATGGIGVVTGNLCLKLAPIGQGTPYLAAIGLVSAVGGGLALGSIFAFERLSERRKWWAPRRGPGD